MGARAQVLVRLAPGVPGQGLLEIGPLPVVRPGIGHQGVQAFLRCGIPADVKPELVQGLPEQLYLGLGRRLLAFSKFREKLWADKGREHRDDCHDHKELDERKTPTVRFYSWAVQHH